MYDDDAKRRPRRGRGALIAASLGVVGLVAAAFGYTVLVPADQTELAKYGRVQIDLNSAPGTTASGGTSATGTATTGAGTGADEPSQTAAAQDGTTGSATGSGTPSVTGESAATGAGTQTATGQASTGQATSATGQTGTGGATATGGGQATTAEASERSGSSSTSGASSGQTGTQTARVPEAPDPPGSGAGGTVTGDSTVTGDAAKPQWQQYARVLSPPEGVDRIAVVVRGLGLSSAASEAAIKRLPGEVSLSFSPYARRSVEWALRARAAGHEVLMDLPMEPQSFPADDPGPKALMTATPTPENLRRLKWILDKGRELVGVVGQMGSAFVTNKRAVGPVMRHLKQRGLIYVDNGDAPGNAALSAARELKLPHAVSDRTLDDGQVSRAAIRGRLVEAERIAQQDGTAVVLAHPYPVTIDLLQDWSRKVGQRGLALVPVTDIVRSPDPPEAAQLR